MLILCLFLAFNFLMYDMHIHALFRVKVCNVNRLDRHTFEKNTNKSQDAWLRRGLARGSNLAVQGSGVIGVKDLRLRFNSIRQGRKVFKTARAFGGFISV